MGDQRDRESPIVKRKGKRRSNHPNESQKFPSGVGKRGEAEKHFPQHTGAELGGSSKLRGGELTDIIRPQPRATGTPDALKKTTRPVTQVLAEKGSRR